MPEELSEKIIRVLQKILIPLAGVTVLVLIASTAIYFIDKSEQEKLAKSYDSLFLLKKEAEKIAEPWTPKAEDAEKKKPAPKMPSNDEKKAAYAALVEKINAHIKANQGNQVAVEGALLVADIGKSYNDYQVGIEALQAALSGMNTGHFLFAIGQSELGSLLAKADKCNEATQAWEKVIPVKEHAYMAHNLRLKSGVCYEKMSMYEKAERLYQDIIDKSPNSSAARTAKKFLLHIKYVKNKGDGNVGEKKNNG